MHDEDYGDPITRTVTVEVGSDRRSSFACPNCGRRVAFRNAFPFGWNWKVCPGCRWQWVNIGLYAGSGIGPHADQAVGTSGRVRVTASGRPV
jgi:hypothetical protein